MNYPVALLPNIQFKQINCDLSSFFLIRKTSVADILHPDTELLKDEVISVDDIYLIDYSTNLLGNFQIDFLKYEIIGGNKKYYNSNWDYQNPVTIPEKDIDFTESIGYGYFLLPINKFHGIVFPFKKGDNKDYIATLLVVHKPTNCNFWHFELRWHTISDGGSPVEFRRNASANWQLSLTSTLKSKIKHFFKASIEGIDISLLSEQEYTKTDYIV